MDAEKLIAAAVRPYLRRKTDAKFAAREILRRLTEAGFALVELPAPDVVSQWGPVWETGTRATGLPPGEYGHVGTVQYRPDVDRIEIRDDYEHDYRPDALEADAAVLLAAVAWSRRVGQP